jgi:DNA mismatch endonuclease (patch repair protein)
LDHLDPEARSRLMSSIRAQGTRVEGIIATTLRSARYRFVSQVRALPGKPDFVMQRYGIAIFAHGCFWHAHHCRRGRSMPATRRAFWSAKKTQNAARDQRAIRSLRRRGYSVLVIWECQLKDKERLLSRIRSAIRRRAAQSRGAPQTGASTRRRATGRVPARPPA